MHLVVGAAIAKPLELVLVRIGIGLHFYWFVIIADLIAEKPNDVAGRMNTVSEENLS